jgi:hypothetical protein
MWFHVKMLGNLEFVSLVPSIGTWLISLHVQLGELAINDSQ